MGNELWCDLYRRYNQGLIRVDLDGIPCPVQVIAYDEILFAFCAILFTGDRYLLDAKTINLDASTRDPSGLDYAVAELAIEHQLQWNRLGRGA